MEQGGNSTVSQWCVCFVHVCAYFLYESIKIFEKKKLYFYNAWLCNRMIPYLHDLCFFVVIGYFVTPVCWVTEVTGWYISTQIDQYSLSPCVVPLSRHGIQCYSGHKPVDEYKHGPFVYASNLERQRENQSS